MLDSRKSNPNCSFAQNVVSYLYDEMSGGEKLKFEQHLPGCLSCGEELGAFSSVSNSIRNWRDAEFASARVPEISRSMYEPVNARVEVDENAVSSRISSLRRLFDFSPLILKTSATFAALAVLIGMGWIIFGGAVDQSSETAKTPNQNSNPVIENESIAVNETERASNAETNIPQIDDRNESTPEEVSKDADISLTGSERQGTVKIARNNRRSSSSGNRVSNRSKRTVPNEKQNSAPAPVFNEVPRLTNEVAVDDSDDLRLSDIFSEIGS